MTQDPRPLTTEPFPLDLVNTQWLDDAGPHDLLDDPAATRDWLARTGNPGAPGDEEARAALRAAREAVRACIPDGLTPARRAALDAVLAHGRLRVRAGDGGPVEHLEAEERWRAPWRAVRGVLELLEQRPGRLRTCANHECVLVFLDVSRNGRRQWCSMEGCGNRAKARRHYARTREAATPAQPGT